MKKETPQYWFCKEGTEEFIVKGNRATAEECCQMYNAVIIKEAKVTVTVDSDGNETVNINK